MLRIYSYHGQSMTSRIVRFALGLVLFSFTASPCRAVSFCSLEIRITDSGSNPQRALVRIYEQGSDKATAETWSSGLSGIASICDLGIRPVKATVSQDGCNEVTVRTIPLRWKETTIVKVVYDPCPRGDFPGPPPCQFLVRIRSVNGSPLSSASLLFGGSAHSDTSDTYGRLFFLLPYQKRFEGELRREGYSSISREFSCLEAGRISEDIVTLQPRP